MKINSLLLKAVIPLTGCLIVLAFASIQSRAEGGSNTDPTVEADQDEVVDVTDQDEVSDQYSTFTAVGGSTEEPPEDRGCPPWTKTGNKKYIWSVTKLEDNDLTADPADGVESTSDTLTTSMSTYGKVSISVRLFEEYQDSSEVPVILYWPEQE